MQSWGGPCRFNSRRTGREPTKSGVIGMVAAAMGRRRWESLDDFRSLRFGVRSDQVGDLIRDYHTVHHPTDDKRSYITERYYLTDATFLVGLEGDDKLLEQIDYALRNPAFPLYLGRRSCPPAGKVSLGIRNTMLVDSLSNEPWLASDWYKKRANQELNLEIAYDSDPNESAVTETDDPLSFDVKHRKYGTRNVVRSINGVHVVNANGRRRKTATDQDVILEVINNVEE